MDIEKFINGLNEEQLKDYNKYSIARGPQMYRIVYDALDKIKPNPSYEDISQVIRYDKGIKDLLFRYLGFIEEVIKTYIFENYDFKNCDSLKQDEYLNYKSLPTLEKVSNKDGTITELYKRFGLSFGHIIELLRDYNDPKWDKATLKCIKELRNMVMHHRTLLFDYNSNFIGEETKNKIDFLSNILPGDFSKYFQSDLEDYSKKKKEIISKEYHKLLIF